MNPQQRTEWVVEQARALGFDLCGVAAAEGLEELERLPEWLERGYAGEMDYLRDPRRNSPARIVPGARSLIVCALNYNTSRPYSTQVPAEPGRDAGIGDQGFRPDNNRVPQTWASAPEAGPATAGAPRGWISRYAWGDDYHDVLRDKLGALVAALRQCIAEPFEARAYVDTGPVVERVAAKYAGLGWLAKNTCLINPDLGSWLFLGVIVTTLDLEPTLGPHGSTPLTIKGPPPDLCGNCRLCIEACPTGAIVEPYVLDARRCISYLTIELRGAIPEEFRAAMGRQVFGCDICQDVCPWNRTAPTTPLPAFFPRVLATTDSCHSERSHAPEGAVRSEESQLLNAQYPVSSERHTSLFLPSLEWLASLTEDEFRKAFHSSAVKRTKWRGLVRNACVALGNSGVEPGSPVHARAAALLERLAASDDAIIAEHARWALDRLV